MDMCFIETQELILQTLGIGLVMRGMLLKICIEGLKEIVWEG